MMKKNTPSVLKTLLTVGLCLVGAVLIWLSVKYSLATSSVCFVQPPLV